MPRVSPISRSPRSGIALVRSRLLAWYDAHRRVLPWRAAPGERADPYRVWLSEIMLQQTTVPHATPYFQSFLTRWPTVQALACAPDAEVMAAWAGLGYYARARNLLACARVVSSDHGGVFPGDAAGLRGLPGVGAYTAAAVAAIAFDEPANVVDGNVERVVARLFAVETPLPVGKGELAGLAARLVTAERPGDWAQALMDLGAVVCRPRSPLCEACPLSASCAARAAGAAEAYPRRLAKTGKPHRHGVAFALTRGGQVAMAVRPPKGLLGGMLGLPTTPWRADPWEAADALAHAPEPGAWKEVGAVRHLFTHFSLDLRVLTARAATLSADRAGPLVWRARAAAAAETPSLFRKALELI